MSKAIENLKKLYSAQAIEKKDISLKDLLAKEGKEGMLVIDIKGLASKHVPKYATADSYGYHTMIYMVDGRKTGAFSNALYEFARFLYTGAQMDANADFNRIEFSEKGHLQVKVSVVPLDGGKSTYNFEIIDGIVDKVERIGGVQGASNFLIGEGPQEATPVA